jgi:hypothetical protein
VARSALLLTVSLSTISHTCCESFLPFSNPLAPLLLRLPPAANLLLLLSNPMSPTFSLKQLAVIFVASLSVLQGTIAQTGTKTLQEHNPRRHTIAKRARAYQCGQIKSNSAQYPNVCVCFDTLGTSVNFGESTAAVTYANSQGFKFPTSVSEPKAKSRFTAKRAPTLIKLIRHPTMVSRSKI